MRNILFLVTLFVGVTALCEGEPLPRNMKMLSQTIPSEGGLTCDAYLYFVKGAKPKSVYFQIFGTGLYSNGSFGATYITRDAAVMNKISSGEMALLMYDKPGLKNNPNDKTKTGDDPLFDKKTFLKYTFSHLQTCTKNALTWSDSILKFHDFILAGHSEGSVVSVNFTVDLFSNPSVFTPKLKALFLSGIAMGDLKELFLDQIARKVTKETKDNFLYQTSHCTDDSEYLYNGHSSCKWMVDAFSRPSMRENLEKLWTIPAATKLNIQAFQAIDDIYTPWTTVADFDRANMARGEKNFPHLNFTARYYVGGHNDGSTGMNGDFNRALAEIFAKTSYH